MEIMDRVMDSVMGQTFAGLDVIVIDGAVHTAVTVAIIGGGATTLEVEITIGMIIILGSITANLERDGKTESILFKHLQRFTNLSGLFHYPMAF
jgi:hypothetical protein